MTGAAGAIRLVATEADRGERLDRFLAARLPDLSRARIQQLIRGGQVHLSQGTPKPALAIDPPLEVRIDLPPPEPAGPRPEALPLTVLYDDEDLAVVDKPAGMVVHPAAGHAGGTLVNALLHHLQGLSGIGGRERPGIVHRLDRGTSGLMVIAKHDRAHRQLARQFQDRRVDKQYVALVWGRVAAGLTLDQPIGRDPRHRQRMSSRAPAGRAALTHVVDATARGDLTLVRVRIATGRTHQIRVHLSEAGHPVAGDALYGGVRRALPSRLAPLARLDRPFLHAAHLGFAHPTSGDPLAFDAPLPADLTAVLQALDAVRPAHPGRE
ncbi:MAG TPA: RluA family pseudouridine synthase [Vicinamibacterales bacterium]|nr:RluA family pseudouridine synthase [Vicinamibacterales bacterium]